MEIGVRSELCEANGVCAALAPEVFELDDDELLHVRRPVSAEEVEHVSEAVESCPKGALFWMNEVNNDDA
ncbi:ferredoxin [Saccharopolyspora sp. MS10]|uniref:ferredoxin n=1 Tax=Saccharopolyspora sp. MS10 TaxID=3385973 RepID=UPI00399F7558